MQNLFIYLFIYYYYYLINPRLENPVGPTSSLMMKAATFGILLTAIVLHHNLVGHCQMMGRCGETELYPWINPSAAGKSLTLSCANLCPDQGPNDQMNCSAWYFRNLVDHSFVRTINLIVKQNSSSCGYYYCKDENRNVTLKSALVLTNGKPRIRSSYVSLIASYIFTNQ